MNSENPYQPPKHETQWLRFSGSFYLANKRCKPRMMAIRKKVVLTEGILQIGSRIIPFEEIVQAQMVPRGMQIILKPTADRAQEEDIFLTDRSVLGYVQTKKLEVLRNIIAARILDHPDPQPSKHEWFPVPKAMWTHLAPAFDPDMPMLLRLISPLIFLMELAPALYFTVVAFWQGGFINGWICFLLVYFLMLPIFVFVGSWILVGFAKLLRAPMRIE